MRYKYQKDYENNCITICDDEEELKTSFGSDIVLSPLEDAEIVINKLNFYELVIKRLSEVIEYEYNEEYVKEIIEETRSDYYD